MPLIRVGFWRPRPPSVETILDDVVGVLAGKPPVRSFAQAVGSIANSNLPWPGDLVDPSWDPRERAAVAAYAVLPEFRSTAWLGLSSCRLCGRENGSLDMTDGTYLWPEGLAHYVTAHGVRPPAGFVEHVVARIRSARR